MSFYEESGPSGRFSLSAQSPAIGKTLSRVQVVSTGDNRSVLVQTRIENAQVLGSVLSRQHWSQVEFVTSEMTATEINDCTLVDVTLRECTLNGVVFKNCFLQNVRFEGDSLLEIRFEDCTILDPSGSLARFQKEGRFKKCVVPSLSDSAPKPALKSAPDKVKAAASQNAARADSPTNPVPARAAGAAASEEPGTTSRFDKLEV